MSAGRPVVYGLCDASGVVFYVGQSRNLNNRLAAYRGGRCHGNRRLADALAKHGVNAIVLCDNPDDLNAAEFEEIESRAGLVNLITNRLQVVAYARSDKPWHVAGVKCPSEQYAMFMRNAFGAKVTDVKDRLSAMCDTARMIAEHRFAGLMGDRPKIKQWLAAV